MTEQGPPTPRRALGPLPEATGEQAAPPGEPDAETRPLRAIFRTDDALSPVSPSETVILRRLAASPSSPGGPPPAGDLPEPVATTPVPPPIPVLPEPPGLLPASAGRRFSASTEPLESASAAPRRSATSVTSPPSPAEPGDGAQEPAEPGAPEKRSRSARRPLIVIAAVAAVALVVGGVVWAANLGGTSTTGNPGVTTSASVPDPLLTSTDLAPLSASGWTQDSASTSPTDESPRPLCLPVSADGLPEAQSSATRRLTSAASPSMSVIHYVDSYADDTEAATAYAVRATETGTCPELQALILDGYRATGLADESTSSTLVVQASPEEYHTLLVSRTGATVNLIDVTSAEEPADPGDVVEAAAAALTRQCVPGAGTCPGTPKATKDVPAPGPPPGWLVEADLPRITSGSGRWGATDPAASLTVVGSQCEAIDLANVTGTTSQGQRTFLLADDPAAPAGFGVDQVTYTYADEADAAAFAKELTSNIKGCAKRTPTAKVTTGKAIKGTGADEVEITGSSFEVTQKVDANRNLRFRVAVITVGNRVGYLLANPSSDFDFTDNAWTALALRAGQRTSQAT